MTTVRDIIQGSLRLISVLGAGETMAAEDAVDGLSSLNQMLSSWSADGLAIYATSTVTASLVAGQAAYTIGVGGDFNTANPVQITKATITLASTIQQVNLWRDDAYALADDVTQQGYPSDAFVTIGEPLSTIRYYPTPIGGLTATLYKTSPLGGYGLDDTITLPEGYERAIRYNLAVELAPEYEREPLPRVIMTANESLMNVKLLAQQYAQAPIGFDTGLSPRYSQAGNSASGFNVYRGY